MTKSLKHQTASAFIWSAIQSWSVKLLALLLFFVLARYLTHIELGLAASVLLVLTFVAVLSEQGYPDAIVQRRGLQHDDLNLPFMLSIITAIFSSCALVFFADDIAHLLKADEAANLIRFSAIIPPLTAATIFQMAMRRRELDFKTLTKAAFAASIISSALALILAVQGYGALSLVAQAVVAAIVSAAYLWTKPIWVPNTKIITIHFRSLFTYSSHAFSSKLLDFFSGKVVDFIILGRYGLAGLGLYTVGSKLYLTILQLLASALMDVALSALSKISEDTARLRQAYLRFIFLASSTTLPLFVLIAALSPEICLVLFGPKWAGAEEITMWLSLLGAIQVVQFFNGAALGSTGHAKAILIINVTKLIAGVSVLALVKTQSMGELTMFYVMSQLAISPLSFFNAMTVTKATLRDILTQILPGLLSATAAFLATIWLRTQTSPLHLGTYEQAFYLSTTFCLVFLALLWVSCSRRLSNEAKYILSSYTK